MKSEKRSTRAGKLGAALRRALEMPASHEFEAGSQTDDRPPGTGRYRAGVTLNDLNPGDCGTIRRLIGTPRGRLRLLEMGLTPGTHVRLIRRAAFGGPLDVLVRGYQLSLRGDEAALLWLDDDESE
jgi:Fe2+ transport system protein FeoA